MRIVVLFFQQPAVAVQHIEVIKEHVHAFLAAEVHEYISVLVNRNIRWYSYLFPAIVSSSNLHCTTSCRIEVKVLIENQIIKKGLRPCPVSNVISPVIEVIENRS